MIGEGELLAIIPARGGSKRLPRKNILDLAGKPLIAWTIESALDSKYIDRVMVSTDYQEIANVSQKYGAEVPFIRPHQLALDSSTSIDVVMHLLDQLKELDAQYEYVILLQPTSPLRTVQNIDESIELIEEKNIDAVISVCKTEHSPLWSNKIPADGSLVNFLDENILNKRSQDLEQYYRLNGAIYLCNTKRLLKEKAFFLSSNCIAYEMDQKNSIDIDTEIDFSLAEIYKRVEIEKS
jgi:CMP-N,N'-diacetyllegionaminic acid synthase